MWVSLAIWAITTLVSYLIRPKPEAPAPAALSDFNAPTVSATRVVPVAFGTVTLRDPNVVWYGDLKSAPIKKGGGLFMAAQTVGYRYYLGAHLVFCYGPVDEVQAIYVGSAPGRQAWPNGGGTRTQETADYPFRRQMNETGAPITANGALEIAAPELFGGEASEGGVAGRVDVMLGGAGQPPNAYLEAALARQLPAFRQVVSLVLNQVYCSANQPAFKPWAARVKRIPTGLDAAHAAIDADANPAHVLYELLTNATYGLGYSAGDVDQASFLNAAQTLYNEGLGVSFEWAKASAIESLQQDLLKVINASLYVDPATGLFTLTLIRDDYDPASLPVFDPGNVVSLDSFERIGWSATNNQVSVTYHDRASDTDRTVTVQDLANIAVQGSVNAATNAYPYVTTAANANRLAMRDLKQLSTPLAKATIVCHRAAAALRIGSVLKFNWPPLNLTSLIGRVVSVDYGTLTAGAVRVQFVEDVFAEPASVYAAPEPSGWVAPEAPPVAISAARLTEAPYYTLATQLDPTRYANGAGALAIQAERPAHTVTRNYRAAIDTGAGDQLSGALDFTPRATLAAAIGLTETTLSYTDASGLNLVRAKTYAYLDDELVGIVSADPAAQSITVLRGVLDTVPAAHAAGATLWFAASSEGLIDAPIADGAHATVKLLPRTALGELDLDVAPALDLTFNHRAIRPYPPGRVRVNGQAAPAYIDGPLSLTWAHRDRTSELDNFVGQDAASIGPETGTTYRVQVYGESGTLIHTETGIVGTSYTYPIATEIAESGLARPNESLTVELGAAREGYTSWQSQQRAIAECRGYGMFYGADYGD